MIIIDAFGVCNFLTLYKETSNDHYLNLAKNLTSAVHDILGRTRDGKSRLPNASDAAPLAGGLRIGKDSASGPDCDGQYHHYLTLWMFALNRLSLASREKIYNDLAIQLARAIHPRFVYNRESSRPRMVWKMSMDLSHPLVRSEGNLDPIDGFVMFRLLQQTDGPDSAALKDEIEGYRKIVNTKWQHYSSEDPLDLGMTLWTSHWFGVGDTEEEWSSSLLNAAKRDTLLLAESGYFGSSRRRRLAFREFGTCVGIKTALAGEPNTRFEIIASKILESWEKDMDVSSSDEMDDLGPINLVMYAAALKPGGMFDYWTSLHQWILTFSSFSEGILRREILQLDQG
jgi:hypothetical protein